MDIVLSIWHTPEDQNKNIVECVSIEFLNQQKRFARIFSTDTNKVEWGWVVHPTSRCTWRSDELFDS